MRSEKKKPVKQKVVRCGECKYCYRFTCCNVDSEKLGKTVMPFSRACKRFVKDDR